LLGLKKEEVWIPLSLYEEEVLKLECKKSEILTPLQSQASNCLKFSTTGFTASIWNDEMEIR
jgi:hypothetical protein